MRDRERLSGEPNTRQTENDIAPTFVRVGRISGAHGLNGGLRMKPDNPASDSLQHVSRVFLQHESTIHEWRLRSAYRINRAAIKLMLEGLSNANAAEALRGMVVMVAKADLPAARPGEFYYFQAVGCDVLTAAGERIGVVAEVFSTGANDVWVVRDGAREVLVPVIEDVVRSTDFDQRRLIIEPVPGLLD